MSVDASKKTPTEFEVGEMSIQLAKHTNKICKNPKVFLRKNSDTHAHLINDTIMIVKLVYGANSLKIEDPDRESQQQQSLELLRGMLGLMQLAYEINRGPHNGRLITGGKMNYWIKLVTELTTKIENWIKSDRKRVFEKQKLSPDAKTTDG